MREDLQQRLVNEYKYAITKMQEEKQPAKKLFYFSVLWAEAQRILNWEWDTDLSLIFLVTQHAHAQITGVRKNPELLQALPIDWEIVFDKLTRVTSELISYLEKPTQGELCQILGRFSEIAFSVSGNGSYLHDKGILKL